MNKIVLTLEYKIEFNEDIIEIFEKQGKPKGIAYTKTMDIIKELYVDKMDSATKDVLPKGYKNDWKIEVVG